MTRRVIAPLVTLLLAGCNFAPAYHRPDEAPPPADYKELALPETGAWLPAQPADEIPRGSWWTIYGDPVLNALEDRVTGANQNLKAAFAQFEQARASAAFARAEYYPTLGASAGANRQRMSRTTANQRPANLYSDAGFNIDLNYEIDVWGRIANTIAAAEGQAEASAGDLATLDLSTHAELASDYFSLHGDDSEQAILDQTAAAYQKAYDLTVQRHEGGIAAAADVAQAALQLQTARTEAADTRLKRQQLEHAIAILTGVPPASFGLPAVPLQALPPPVTPGLPAALLERRPDVAAAERRAFAANAEIGVARAAFYPALSLSALGGFESAVPQDVFTWPSHLWTLGANASLPVFDAGQRNAVVDEARAAYDQAAADYRQTVLDAFRDVEDNLAALHELSLESETETAATGAAAEALRQARLRYSGGLVTYLEVVTAENNLLQAEISAADIAARRMAASVALIKALGGGWRADRDPDPAGLKVAEVK